MNKLKIVPLLFMVGLLAFAACEKDDICVDADTPRLVLRFYSIEDTTEFKDVQNLIVRGLTDSGAQDTITNSALDSVVLPLRVTENSTSFTLSRQTSIDDINIDTITFSYNPMEIFASRACGYIVNFDGLQATVVQDDSIWIQETRIITSLIENTASAHVKILH